MAAALVSTDEGVIARVAEDLLPFHLPYFEDIRAARGHGPACVGWVKAVAAARPHPYPGGGPSPPESAVTAREGMGSSAGPSQPGASALHSPTSSSAARIVSYDPVDHRDVSDASFDCLNHVPSDRVS